ncbi:hypothetical protein AAZX31_11G188800 [Glycine max]|uniref:Uncharacterized protein n=2 Tax=Glycine subgen. Soja TaxID=1462606 RepID=K7LR11_SOYBN|nr:hypothetical protein GYH30_031439 [Glycine max]KHN22783.1 Cation/H(+) antiporter 20 [Glycine soja]KRH30157.1 hypothetical protein GLYMA_11G163500v4 [Glycine max]RZB80743.1 Cation/H(+) antiporter 20 [Glycine soja]
MSLNSSCIFNIDEGKPGRQPHSQCHACWNYQGRHVGSFICHSTVNQINSKGIWFGDDPLAYYLPVFLLQVFLMFIFSRFIHLILNPSGQPSFVSQIIGGLTLGSSILGHNTAFMTRFSHQKEEM